MTKHRRAVCVRRALWLGAPLAALPAPAFAQSTTTEPVSASQPVAVTEGEPATEEPQGEILVTAQRRSERLVDVPIALSSFSQDFLEANHVDGLTDLAKVTPGVRFESGGGVFQPTVRGVGSAVFGIGFDPAVALYIDGFLQAGFFDTSDLLNVSNVQVLRGPQGTLFGRNATGGAILVTTAEPAFEPTGRVKLSYGNFDDIRAKAYLSGPISENVAADIAVNFRDSCGYLRNVTTGDKCDGKLRNFNIRPSLLLTNHGNLKLRLIYQHDFYSNPANQRFIALDGYAVAANIPGAQVSSDFRTITADYAAANRVETDAAYADLSIELSDNLTLKSLSSYRNAKSLIKQDFDLSSLPILGSVVDSRLETITQEVTLGGKTGALDWIAGVYYYDSKGSLPNFQFVLGGVPKTITSSRVDTKAVAGFADATLEVGDGLFLTAGARFSTERKEFSFRPGGVLAEQRVSERWNSFTPRAVVRYELAPDTNVYASYSKGFKAGGFNANSFQTTPVAPEKITAYELGFKTATPTVSFNLSAFYYQYTNLQITEYDFSSGSNRVINADGQRNYGAEADVTARVTPEWRVGAGVAYLNAKYRSFPDASGAFRNAAGGWTFTSFDATGFRAIRSPELAANLFSDYRIDLGSGEVELAANLGYVSSFFFDAQHLFRQSGYALVDANIAYIPADQRWRFDVYAKNLTDHAYPTSAGAGATGSYAGVGAPRTYGASVSFNF